MSKNPNKKVSTFGQIFKETTGQEMSALTYGMVSPILLEALGMGIDEIKVSRKEYSMAVQAFLTQPNADWEQVQSGKIGKIFGIKITKDF